MPTHVRGRIGDVLGLGIDVVPYRNGESVLKSNLKELLCVFCIAPDVYATQT